MKKYKLSKYILTGLLAASLISCHDDLDLTPNDPDSLTESMVFSNPEQAKNALAKVYSSLALTGLRGPSGDPAKGEPDIEGIDEGASQYTRLLFMLNVLTTDESVLGWGDAGVPNLHAQNWGADNPFTQAMYYRLAQVVSFSNSFISNAKKLEETNAELTPFIAEARFIRAYAYYNLMDLYANVPLLTEISNELPTQSNRKEIFAFVESELLDIENTLLNPRTNEYGRVDKAAAYALLSRLYLNAETWINEAKYSEAAAYSEKAITSGYILNEIDANGNGTAYDELFLADNDRNGAQNEFIFVLNFDGNYSRSYGGSTFLIKAPVGGEMNAADFGINGGWGGPRTTKALVEKFDATQYNNNAPIAWADKRAMFFTQGQKYEISNISTFTDGYAVGKFSNLKSDGLPGSDSTLEYTDTDVPVIRVAEMYLNYAEAVLRGGNGSTATALEYINRLRARGYGQTANITAGELTLDFVLDERARELYWEGTRRTDLVRYNKFTTASYLWPYKGNVSNGTSVSDNRNIFPIPTNLIMINTNLTQNPGY